MNNVSEWHRLFNDPGLGNLEALLDKNATFYSPLVFKPQEGRKLTAQYLKAAYQMFYADGNETFTYVREINESDDTVLEFTCEIDGILINGVDMIKWNEAGKIVEFKVMLRPNKAIEKVKEKMGAILSNMSTVDKMKMKIGVILDKIKK